MKKIILFIAMIFLLISCSNNNYIKTVFSQNEKQELILFKEKIKNNLSENNLAYIKENTKDSYRNRYILEKLQNIDFTKLNIFVSEPSYTNEENFEKEINRIKIFIPSFLSSLSTVRAMVRVYLREHRISELDEIQLLSVVDELTTNAVEHAYRYDKGEIKIVLNFYKKTIFLTVEDFGKGYDEKLDSKEDGGFGLSIARKLVDVFEIEKKTKGTVFKVEKRIKEAV